MTETFASPHGTEAQGQQVTRDAFLDGAIMLLQPGRGYRAGIDAVFLGAAAQTKAGCDRLTVLDAGAGVGTAGLLAAKRLGMLADVRVTLIEREPELVALAERNARENGLGHSTRVVAGDFLAPAADLEALGVARDSFDIVLANPPYHEQQRGTLSADPLKAGANAMEAGDLERWVRAMARHTRAGGEAIVVHKADALGELLAAFAPRFGGVRILPLYPRQGEAASRVIVAGTKGSRAPLKLLAGLVLHGQGNDFTPEAAAILRHGEGLWS